jgi:hypothetical protein
VVAPLGFDIVEVEWISLPFKVIVLIPALIAALFREPLLDIELELIALILLKGKFGFEVT